MKRRYFHDRFRWLRLMALCTKQFPLQLGSEASMLSFHWEFTRKGFHKCHLSYCEPNIFYFWVVNANTFKRCIELSQGLIVIVHTYLKKTQKVNISLTFTAFCANARSIVSVKCEWTAFALNTDHYDCHLRGRYSSCAETIHYSLDLLPYSSVLVCK